MEPRIKRILLVDDDEGFRYATEKILQDAGYEVVTAPDYVPVLARLEAGQTFDLLLTDIVMPERVHGFALARMARLRQRDLKVLYLTAYDVPADDADAKILRKSIASEDLINEVRLLVGD